MNAIPQSLVEIAPGNRWVVWTWEARKGKPTKPPRMVKMGRPVGYAHNDKPATWTSLQAAQEAAQYADGIGLQLLGLEGFCALDLDDVRDAKGVLFPWAADLIGRAESYAEFTPSGNGARILGRIPIDHPTIHTKIDHPGGGHFEIYANLTEGSGRYVTVTGDRIDSTPEALGDISHIVCELMQLREDGNGKADRAAHEGQRRTAFDFDAGAADMPGWVRVYLTGGGTGDRSRDFQSIVNALRPRGWSFDAALKLFQDYPEGPGGKYAERLEKELQRSWAKATAPGGTGNSQADERGAWPDPDPRFLRAELPQPPALPLRDVLGPRLAQWVADAAEAKGAPADYVFAAVLSVAGATIGNARWASPWRGWNEPPVIWTMCIGLPSAGKSPAIDAALQPLRKAERPLREAAEAQRKAWAEKAELAKLAEQTWKETAKAAIKAGDTPPDRPKGCDIEPAPHVPRLVVNDGTIERLGAILAQQPRGTLQMRDELAGWLEGMQRYAGGGTDRPFWLEAFGGRGFTVERMGRDPLTIDRLSIGVLGGIQPDRLKTLLFKSDDDGLLARFLPIWPDPAPLRRPQSWADESLMEAALAKLLTLDLVTDDAGELRPWFMPFTDDARGLMDDFRLAARGWESGAEGLMLSFLGKLPGLTARLALVLAFLDWAAEGAEEPHEITVQHFGRAAHLVEAYFLPMARRAYADAATPKADRAARRLVGIIREQGWQRFTSRDVLRLDRAGLGSKAELDPALALLTDGECIRPIDPPANPQGGRPQRLFTVNPAILGG